MVYVIQLVYLNPGKETTFQAFEDVVIPRIASNGGELLLRVRPNSESVIAAGIEIPYEIHVVRFGTEGDFTRFSQDEARRQALHLKTESVRHSILLQGFELSSA